MNSQSSSLLTLLGRGLPPGDRRGRVHWGGGQWGQGADPGSGSAWRGTATGSGTSAQTPGSPAETSVR